MIKFKDKKHQQAYEEYIKISKIRNSDVERKSLFYLLAMFPETRGMIHTLYDFKNNWINHEGLSQGWQTSGTLACCKLAFNLYNSFDGIEDDEAYKYSVINIFTYVDNDNKNYFFEAIRIRFEMI